MALTETRPTTTSPVSEAGRRSPIIEGTLGTGDHKTVGRLFMGGGLIGLIGGLVVGVVSVFYSYNFDDPAADAWDYLPQVWSLSRELVMFGGLVPILVGLGLYLVPLQVGAPSVAFPRGAAAALWTWLLGTGLLILAYVFNGGPGGGRRDFVVLWAASLAVMLGALVWALVCLATTILGARTVGMTLERAPITTWSYLVFALVGIFSLPIVMGELLLSFLRIRYFHLLITDSSQLTAVGDGFSLAPPVYWLAIPALGLAVDVIAVHTGVPVRRHQAIMGAIGLFGILAFGADVLGLTSVRGIDFNNGLFVVAILVAVLPVLATLGLAGDSIRRGAFVPRVPLVGALLSGLLLLLATVVSLLGLVEPIMGFLDSLFPDSIDMTNTLILNGTRFHEGVRALVVGAAALGVIAAMHHWSVKIWGRRLAEPLGFLALLATAGGAVIFAVGEVAAGVDDQPWLPQRAFDDYSAGLATISLVGAAILAAGVAMAGANLAMSVLGSKPAGTGTAPWSGTTLEWATPSPPPPGNFPGPPIVRSANPLADGELQYALIDTDGPAASDGDGSDEQSEPEGEES